MDGGKVNIDQVAGFLELAKVDTDMSHGAGGRHVVILLIAVELMVYHVGLVLRLQDAFHQVEEAYIADLTEVPLALIRRAA